MEHVLLQRPWTQLPARPRGQLLLDLCSAGLIAFVPLLVIAGGSSFSLLVFVTIPFIATVQRGWRRRIWLGAALSTCTVTAVAIPLSAGATAVRLGVLVVAVGMAVVLAEQLRREVAARDHAAARAAAFDQLEAELGRTRQELEERKLIERAKGLLMTALRVSEQDAFRTLQKAARDRNLRLAEVARRVVESSPRS